MEIRVENSAILDTLELHGEIYHEHEDREDMTLQMASESIIDLEINVESIIP